MLQNELTEQLENISNLRVILEEEKRCLTEKNFSSFNDVLFNKQKLLQSIATLDTKLTTEENLKKIENNENLIISKNTIEESLKDCQNLNNINGKLVELSMKSNKHLMQIMKQATGQNSVTYDQKGSLNTGKLLGKNIQA